MLGAEDPPPGAHFKCDKAGHGAEKKTAFHLNSCQDAVQTVDKQGTGKSIPLLCLDKVGQFLPSSYCTGKSSDLLGLAAIG